MKILLVNTIDARDSTAIPHLGLAYLASYLRKYRGSDEIKITDNEIDSCLLSFKPDIVGISSVSQNYSLAKEIARKVKKSGAITVVGGVHITLLPKTLDGSMDI